VTPIDEASPFQVSIESVPQGTESTPRTPRRSFAPSYHGRNLSALDTDNSNIGLVGYIIPALTISTFFMIVSLAVKKSRSSQKPMENYFLYA